MSSTDHNTFEENAENTAEESFNFCKEQQPVTTSKRTSATTASQPLASSVQQDTRAVKYENACNNKKINAQLAGNAQPVTSDTGNSRSEGSTSSDADSLQSQKESVPHQANNDQKGTSTRNILTNPTSNVDNSQSGEEVQPVTSDASNSRSEVSTSSDADGLQSQENTAASNVADTFASSSRHTKSSHSLPTKDDSQSTTTERTASHDTARHRMRKELIEALTTRLEVLYEPREARSIALVAVAELAGASISTLLTDPAATLDAAGFDQLATQLEAGRPVQYALGHTEFYGHSFAVREGVLIPRPETEELVDWIIRAERNAKSLLDVGTGSGCIAASLALALPEVQVYATDISDAALAVAAENFRTLGAEVVLRKADALKDLEEVFQEPLDVVVSNPPYVPQSDLGAMHRNVRDYEPHEALFVPDNDPLRFYRAIAHAGRRMLRAGGRLYFEIYERFGDDLRQMLVQEGYTDTELRDDLNGKPRMLCSRLK